MSTNLPLGFTDKTVLDKGYAADRGVLRTDFHPLSGAKLGFLTGGGSCDMMGKNQAAGSDRSKEGIA